VKVVKISDKLHEVLVSLAEKRKRETGVEISVSQLIEEIVNVYLGGQRDGKTLVKVNPPREIQNEYDNVYCAKCKRKIEVNEMCMWIKYEYADGSARSVYYCLDCWYSTSALAKQYLTKKKLELTVKGLRQEADKLVEEIKKLQQQLEEIKIQLDVRQALAKIREELEYLFTRELITLQDFRYFSSKVEELLLRLEELEKKTRPVPLELEKEKEKVKERARLPRV
jgi:vacuolar-type H+-ATPase subunit I/STV1